MPVYRARGTEGLIDRAIDGGNVLMMLLSQASVGMFGVAALLTIWLTIASRRATFEQINANLLAIAAELKPRLGEGSPPGG